jgi:hypothetical protein
MNPSLRFRSDGTFRIIQFTDLHWKNGEPEDLRTRALMERVITEEQPDLIVFSGDVIESLLCQDPIQSFRDAVAVADKSGIPWAAIFGNHDCESDITKEQLMMVQLEHKGSLADAGPPDVDGLGNYIVQLSDSNGNTAAALYFLDSGSYSELPSVPGYDWIRQSQVEWYRAHARILQEKHGGVPVPALMFFHIPLTEYRELWQRHTCYGHRYEKVSCPQVNSGLFAAMVESGGVMGTFCGHDHTNDYTGMLHGIRLCYGRASGYNTYGRWTYARGARIIELQNGGQGFTTWLRLANGKKVLHSRKHYRNCFSRG